MDSSPLSSAQHPLLWDSQDTTNLIIQTLFHSSRGRFRAANYLDIFLNIIFIAVHTKRTTLVFILEEDIFWDIRPTWEDIESDKVFLSFGCFFSFLFLWNLSRIEFCCYSTKNGLWEMNILINTQRTGTTVPLESSTIFCRPVWPTG